METNTKPFRKWLLEMMERKDLNQTSLAIHLGRSQPTVSAWVRGTTVPDEESCRKIADFFDVPLDVVLVLAGHMLPGTITTLVREWKFLPGTPQYELFRLIDRMSSEEVDAILHIVKTFRRNSDS
jgi:transcriptional regulator with XRE-family HTH domain